MRRTVLRKAQEYILYSSHAIIWIAISYAYTYYYFVFCVGPVSTTIGQYCYGVYLTII